MPEILSPFIYLFVFEPVKQRFDADKVKYMMEVTMLKKRQEKMEAKLVSIFFTFPVYLASTSHIFLFIYPFFKVQDNLIFFYFN